MDDYSGQAFIASCSGGVLASLLLRDAVQGFGAYAAYVLAGLVAWFVYLFFKLPRNSEPVFHAMDIGLAFFAAAISAGAPLLLGGMLGYLK